MPVRPCVQKGTLQILLKEWPWASLRARFKIIHFGGNRKPEINIKTVRFTNAGASHSIPAWHITQSPKVDPVQRRTAPPFPPLHVVCTKQTINDSKTNKKAMLSQRWPRNAPYTWVPWKFSGLPDYAHGYYSQHCFMGFCCNRPYMNDPTKFEVRSFTCSMRQEGVAKLQTPNLEEGEAIGGRGWYRSKER